MPRPRPLMKGLGYGKGYQYSHDVEGKLPGWIASRNLLRSIAIFLCPGIWRRSRNQTSSWADWEREARAKRWGV